MFTRLIAEAKARCANEHRQKPSFRHKDKWVADQFVGIFIVGLRSSEDQHIPRHVDQKEKAQTQAVSPISCLRPMLEPIQPHFSHCF